MNDRFQTALRSGCAVLSTLWIFGAVSAAHAVEVKTAAPLDFSHQIAPLLKEQCSGCHMADKKKGGFSMNTRALFLAGSENGKVAGDGPVQASILWKVLTSQDPDVVMPPPAKDRKPPTPEQRQLLLRWVEAGTPWDEGFAFQRPAYEAPVKHRPPVLPASVAKGENPLDALLAGYFQKRGVPFPASVDDAAFARRVSLDLIGLLPDVEALQAFVKDTTPDKRARFIDALLARKADYAEHWLTFWNDLLRNDYGGTGFITGGRKQVSTWLYASLMENKPYDRMVRELVNPSADTEGFAQGITWRGTVSASQTREVQFAQSVSQSFLGLNLKCASCHDSFIDKWKLTDAYGLAAVYSDKPIEIARCEKATGKMAVAAWPFPELGQIDPNAARPARLEKLAELMTSKDNGWFARTMANRLWASLLGRGLVHPVDAMGTEPWSEELLDYLGWSFAQNGFDLKALLRVIANSRAYQALAVQRSKDDASEPFVFRGPRAKRMTAEQFMDAVWQIVGNAPKSWDAPVRRGEPAATLLASKTLAGTWIAAAPSAGDVKPGANAAPVQKGKLAVLRTVFNLEQKPVRAVGICASGSDLRVFINGNELKGGQLQKFERVLEVRPEGQLNKGENTIVLTTPENAHKASAPVFFALEIGLPDGSLRNVVSDQGWQSTGSFNEEAVKAGKLAPKAAEFLNATWIPSAAASTPTDAALSAERLHRDFVWSLQPRPPARAALLKSDLLMRTLGRPNRDQIVTSRPQDMSTLEALDLSAGARLTELLAAGAGRLTTDQKLAAPGALVDWLYTSALGRPPVAEEKAAALEMLGEKPSKTQVEDLLWSVFVLPEFQLVR